MKKAIEAELADSAEWTGDTWYAVARSLEGLASDRTLPGRLRRWLQDRAEAAWATGDWRNGIGPDDWAAECATYQAEDAVMVSRANAVAQRECAMV